MVDSLSIVVPAKNEAGSLVQLLPELTTVFPDAEIIVVNDGSTDQTSAVCSEQGVKEVRHVNSIGNGGAVKAGARAAKGEVLAFLDGDGQHSAEDLRRLLNEFEMNGFDMVVGARTSSGQASVGRLLANTIYNKLAGWMVGRKVDDLTSGMRVVSAEKFREFLYLLPNGFSYPTTSTMAFFRAGYQVGYVPITAAKREGRSHINVWKDGVRFLLIIFKVGTLYSPIKIFFPLALLLFFTGVGYYGYTYAVFHRFTNMGMLLFTTSLIVFLMGLISEQITTLMYNRKQ
ncbi:glycosyltransferase family 2 protein [Saccharophagus degradans]|uniref:glycosyltransferase family 2 protein n=1 Tax=Saccharophagus degradans TaxID=86304 RepID=UPI002477D55C|nr:glycosyltransferase family 2 protein [Saccharophagus degradans]WGO97691.1 glycosyltransferase family 2 protein [Saccharophagus degradans]